MKSGKSLAMRRGWSALLVGFCLGAIGLLPSLALAETPKTESSAALDSAAPPPQFAWQAGPEHVDLGHELDLNLPDAYGYLPNPDAKKLMEKLGNLWNDDLLGLIAPKGDGEWLIVLRFVADGYIKDDESIDAAEILTSIKDGTEEGNKERTERGFKALHVDGWGEPPHYDKAGHHLIWAINAHDDNGSSVNYNTRMLGRRGYISVNLITDPKTLSVDRPHAANILHATHFRRGARYEDFDSKTDKVAEYGLAGLVLAGAGLGALKLVKLGLLAKFSKVIIGLLIAGKKLIVGAVVAASAGIKAFLNRRKEQKQV